MKLDPDQNAAFAARQELERRGVLDALFDMGPAAIIVADGKTQQVIAGNSQALAFFGFDLRQLRKRRLADLTPEIRSHRTVALLNRLRTCPGRSRQFRLKTNEQREYLVRAVCINAGKPTLIAIITDETAQAHYRDRVQQAESQLTTAINALADGFVYYDNEDRLVICNDNYRAIYPKSAHRMTEGTTFREILQAGLDAGEYVDAIGREDEWLEQRLSAYSRENSMVEQQLSTGRWLRVEERRTPGGGRVGLRIDITELKHQQARLERMMLTDELTGLRNRRKLLDDIRNWGASLDPQTGLGIIHLDIRRFKQVNAIYGYDAGDRLLRQVAAFLQDAARIHGLAARIGGNEFLFAKEITLNDPKLEELAEQLCRGMSNPVICDGQRVGCAVAAGVAILDPREQQDESISILGAAEMALTDAKQSGRSVAFFRPRMRAQALSDGGLTRDLQDAVARDEFEAFFQPQVDAVTHCCFGFEALLRWRHPQKGVLAANAFLGIAQRAGLTEALDTIVLEQTCKALTHLDRIGRSDLTISVNLSANQVADPKLLPHILDVLNRHGVARHRIRLELLESTLLDERTSHYLSNIENLVKAGFVMELDDFGTGHAAIASLRKFKVNQIKIDRSFVQNLDLDLQLQALTGAIIGLADRLGVGILAEGVETPAEQDCLIRMGCTRAQGWLYEKALPLDQLSTFLSRFEASKT
ncbi:diguanylate cyclase (GGDEF) domain-containing protein [Loktanella sp. DSM 29012]|uniref:putative bifunctional diguanylate cyclase/phosphodiesterase n=1 Tax=Loktanella sp. DSM 29012 TaxID=1881056 RepID=UPI0008C1B497|nr:EAL domain-containing protein [Loktanella sp. DSM 29012]SEP66594.1 diguanylate cyclase (GGDEF) domain-containing protein [Loktanella sp. DSM 29012]